MNMPFPALIGRMQRPIVPHEWVDFGVYRILCLLWVCVCGYGAGTHKFVEPESWREIQNKGSCAKP